MQVKYDVDWISIDVQHGIAKKIGPKATEYWFSNTAKSLVKKIEA